jgi:hypothetical protein
LQIFHWKREGLIIELLPGELHVGFAIRSEEGVNGEEEITLGANHR